LHRDVSQGYGRGMKSSGRDPCVFGILSISNALRLKYPFIAVIENLSALCDQVLVGIDPNFPEDSREVRARALLDFGRNVSLLPSAWNRENRNGGTEIAIQMDLLIAEAERRGAGWVVVMQADEMILDDDFNALRSLMSRAPERVIGFKTKRLYFWRDLETLRKDWKANLVRIFRPGTCSFMAPGATMDGMNSAPVKAGKILRLPYHIHHYGRIGDPRDISMRVRTLDGWYHSDDELIPVEKLPAYDFVPRSHDYFGWKQSPQRVDGAIAPYRGPHPAAASTHFGLQGQQTGSVYGTVRRLGRRWRTQAESSLRMAAARLADRRRRDANRHAARD
jgi:hypothetical protein